MAKRKALLRVPIHYPKRVALSDPLMITKEEEEEESHYQCLLHDELVRKNIPNFRAWNARPNTLFVGKFHVFLNLYENHFCSPLAKVRVPTGFLSKIEVELIATRLFKLYVLCNDHLLKKLALLKDYQLGCFCRPEKPKAIWEPDGTWNARCHCDVLQYLIDMFEEPEQESKYQVAGIKMPTLDDRSAVLQNYFNVVDHLELVGKMLDPHEDVNVMYLHDRHWKDDLTCKKHLGHCPCLCYRCRVLVYNQGRDRREFLGRELRTEDKAQFFAMSLKERAEKYRVSYIAKEIMMQAVSFFGQRRNPAKYNEFELNFKRMVQNTERASFKETVGPQAEWMHIDEDYDPHVDGAVLLAHPSLFPCVPLFSLPFMFQGQKI